MLQYCGWAKQNFILPFQYLFDIDLKKIFIVFQL